MKWSERQIAAYLARVTFHHKHLVIVPNCSWPGSECDLLVVTPNLRIIDVEIKISRSDVRADSKKEKWYQSWDWKIDGPYKHGSHRRPREFPRRVWKHYYCMPEEIWTPDLIYEIATISGVLLIRRHKREDDFWIHVERQAKPNREAEKLNAEDAIDIARIASMRMWSAFQLAEEMKNLFETRQAA